MIRVTYKDNDVVIVEEYQYCNHQFQLHSFFDDSGCLSLTEDNIIKIEKQVKDLTLEEMIKLKARFSSDYWFEEYSVNTRTKIYDLDDYIDITDLVKEQRK